MMTNIAKLFEPSKTIERGAFVIALVTALGSILGILKNTLLGARFGAGVELDLYFAAFRIPDFLYNMLIFSTLSSSFLPVFSGLIAQGKDRVWEVLSSLMLVFCIGLGICALAVIIFADGIMEVLAPGFSSFDAARLVLLVRILMVQPILLAVSNLIAMTLQGFKRFFVSSCAPVFYNLGIILGVVLFAQWWGIYGVAYGVIAGALFHLLVQLPSLRALGFRFRFAVAQSLAPLKEMFTLMVPRSLALLANNLLSLWVVAVSSLLSAGSLAIFDFANTVQSLPQTVFALSFITAAFPFMTAAWARAESREGDGEGARKEFFALVERTAGNIFGVMLPIAILLGVFAPVAVRILFGYGSFSADAQSQTGAALLMFCVGLPFQSFLMLMVRVFFAMKNTKLPLYSVVVVSALTIPAIWLMGVKFGVAGIALAMSMGAILNALFLWFALRRFAKGIRFPLLRKSIRNGLVMGVFASVPSGIVYYILHLFVGTATAWAFVFSLMVAALVGFVSLFIAIYVLKLVSLKEWLARTEPAPTGYAPGTDS